MSTMQTTPALEVTTHLDLINLVFGAMRQEIQIRQSRLELSKLSAHMLQDLGLTRDEVKHMVRHGRYVPSCSSWGLTPSRLLAAYRRQPSLTALHPAGLKLAMLLAVARPLFTALGLSLDLAVFEGMRWRSSS